MASDFWQSIKELFIESMEASFNFISSYMQVFAIRLLICIVSWLFAQPVFASLEESESDRHVQRSVDQERVLIYRPQFFAASNPLTASDMISRLPGFNLDEGEQLRGYGVAVGNVLINGTRPVSKRESLSGVLQRIPAERVERIELVRGGIQGIEMGGHDVVANVILKETAFSHHSLTAEANLFRGGPHLYGGRYDFTTLRDGQEYRFQVGRDFPITDSTGEGHSVRRRANDEIIANQAMLTAFDANAWHARGGWTGSIGSGAMEISVGVEDNEFDYRETLSSDQNDRRIVSEMETTAADFALRYDQAMSESVWLESRLIQNLSSTKGLNIADDQDRHQVFEFARDQGETIARSLAKWAGSKRISAEAGFELVYNFFDAEQQYINNGTAVELPLATTRVEEQRVEVITQMLWRANETLQFELGLNVEHSRIDQSGDAEASRSFLYPKPRLVMTWQPADEHQLRARLERELGQLNFEDFAASTALSDGEVHGGNINLKPQQRWIGELAYEYRFRDEGVLTLTLRHDEIRDAIDVIPLDDGLTAIGNIGNGSLDRVAMNLRLPLESMGLEGVFVTVEGRYDRTRVTDPTTGETRALSGVRPFDGAVRLKHDVPGSDLTWGVTWLPYYRQTNFQPDQRRYITLRDYYIVFAEYQFRDDLDVRAQLVLWDDFQMGRDVYSDRHSRDIAFTERQHIDPRDILKLTLRKTF